MWLRSVDEDTKNQLVSTNCSTGAYILFAVARCMAKIGTLKHDRCLSKRTVPMLRACSDGVSDVRQIPPSKALIAHARLFTACRSCSGS